MNCIYCGSIKFHGFESFSKFKTVTSDSKPWQSGFEIGVCGFCGFPQTRVTEAWKISARKIYRDYFSVNANQIVGFDRADVTGAKVRNRVDLFAEFVLDELSTKNGGCVLDYGCGGGKLLRYVSKLRSDLNLFGYDLDDRQLKNLQNISNFKHLIVGKLETNLKFDLVFMSHTLEHLTNPIESLNQLRDLLNNDGILAIAVPDCSLDPFKLLIADHCSHFSVDTLSTLLTNSGFNIVHIESRLETRECWAVCKRGKPMQRGKPVQEGNLLVKNLEWLEKSIDWISVVRSDARKFATEYPFGIFGTSINALWLFGELELDVNFFVDEDVSRQGTRLFGRPVLSPSEVVEGSVVYLPFVPALATQIALRLERKGVSWLVPPSAGYFTQSLRIG